MASVDPISTENENAGITHPCLVRKSARIYDLLDPESLGDAVSFDVGQIKAFVLFDSHLRFRAIETRNDTQSARRSVPSGYLQFAERFNLYATGPERFATFVVNGDGTFVISVDGNPIVWDQFMIEDALVAWSHSDAPPSLDESDPFVLIGSTEVVRKGEELGALVGGRMELLVKVHNFHQAWASVEKDYAQSLRKLSSTLQDSKETGVLRRALETIRNEILAQSEVHLEMADQIPKEAEAAHMMREHQALLRTMVKCPETSELEVSDEDKLELDMKVLEEKVEELEEKRVSFLKTAFWEYANMLSTSCVADDESCERIRTSLEEIEDSESTPEAPAVSVSSFSPAPRLLPKECLFHVQALYDYKGGLPTQMDFNQGDIILVKGINEGGWWFGEHVEVKKRVAKKAIFPSNFVQIFGGQCDVLNQMTQSCVSSNSTSTPVASLPVEPSSPSSSPTTHSLLPSKVVKFYVKALYNFEGQCPTDMSFEKDDIIGIIATPHSGGWWHGEMRDVSKRVPGKFTLPSNYVMIL